MERYRVLLGHISANELLHVKLENFPRAHTNIPIIARWTSWPLVDWNMANLLWRSCGGLLVLIVVASIIPGRLHVLSGQILRWPVLALTYLTIASELVVYTMVRLFIRLAETIFTTPKHRELRKALEEASTYKEWLSIARKLDHSKQREVWQNSIDDDTSYRYNWAFIKELMEDLKEARRGKDIILTLIVLQQCARKNVGGIMNEDLFSFTYSGEPKIIVNDFLEEVCKSLTWLTKVSTQPPPKKSRSIDINVESIESNEKEQPHNKNIFEEAMNNVLKPATHHVMNQVASIGPVQWALEVASRGQENDTQQRSVGEVPLDVEDEDEELVQEQLFLQNRERVKTFLKRARAAYGRTALCLSGGGAMGW